MTYKEYLEKVSSRLKQNGVDIKSDDIYGLEQFSDLNDILISVDSNDRISDIHSFEDKGIEQYLADKLKKEYDADWSLREKQVDDFGITDEPSPFDTIQSKSRETNPVDLRGFMKSLGIEFEDSGATDTSDATEDVSTSDNVVDLSAFNSMFSSGQLNDVTNTDSNIEGGLTDIGSTLSDIEGSDEENEEDVEGDDEEYLDDSFEDQTDEDGIIDEQGIEPDDDEEYLDDNEDEQGIEPDDDEEYLDDEDDEAGTPSNEQDEGYSDEDDDEEYLDDEDDGVDEEGTDQLDDTDSSDDDEEYLDDGVDEEGTEPDDDEEYLDDGVDEEGTEPDDDEEYLDDGVDEEGTGPDDDEEYLDDGVDEEGTEQLDEDDSSDDDEEYLDDDEEGVDEDDSSDDDEEYLDDEDDSADESEEESDDDEYLDSDEDAYDDDADENPYAVNTDDVALVTPKDFKSPPVPEPIKIPVQASDINADKLVVGTNKVLNKIFSKLESEGK